MKKNKYIKIFTLLLLFSFIVSDTMSVFYSKSYVLSAEIDDDIKTQEESGKTEESDQNIQNNKQSDKKEQKENKKKIKVAKNSLKYLESCLSELQKLVKDAK